LPRFTEKQAAGCSVLKKKTAIEGRQELERRILHGLQDEWKEAVWVLDPIFRDRMAMPFFRLSDARDKWGQWSAGNREISIGRRLVYNHPWCAVREVLLHELAHQLSDELLGNRGGPPHGPIFQKACELLRANPEASGSYPPLDERIASVSPDPQDRQMLKIRKLFALAESANPYEAERALAKARELAAKCNLKRKDGSAGQYASFFVGEPALRHAREHYLLASILQDFYFVKGIWVAAYVLDRCRMGRVLEISGRRENVLTAMHVHDYIRRFEKNQWLIYRKEHSQRIRRSDFTTGILEGFRQSLSKRAARKPDGDEIKDLVKAEDRRLGEYIKWKYPSVVQFRTAGRVRDANVVRDGRRIGNRITIPENANGDSGPCLLPAPPSAANVRGRRRS